MKLSWRQLALIVVLGTILAAWAAGLSWVFGLEWLPVFVSLTLGGLISSLIHYKQGAGWMIRQFDARPINSKLIQKLAKKAGLSRAPRLYVTRSMIGANAFSVSYADEDAVFVTPEIHRARTELKAPILAHELAHIKHNDSLVMGFVSAFEQMIGNIGRLWMVLLLSGVLGWIVLLFFWPFLFLIQALSTLTLALYQPFAATLFREREFLADEAAADWTSPDSMKAALRNLEHYNRRWIPGILRNEEGPLSTHPPLDRRLKRLEEARRNSGR